MSYCTYREVDYFFEMCKVEIQYCHVTDALLNVFCVRTATDCGGQLIEISHASVGLNEVLSAITL